MRFRDQIMSKINLPTSALASHPQQAGSNPAPLWSGLPWVMGLCFGLRLMVALVSKEIIHPDEIFQYLEQAHRLVFGYGIVPWEYVHGIRSWLLPMALALPLWISHKLGINDPHLYIPVIQATACWVSLSAIFCTYWIGRQLWSESAGRIASVLTAVWWEMLFWAHKVTPEIIGMYLLLGALACLVSTPTRWLALLFGICSATAVALRLQYAPAIAILIAVVLVYGWQGKWPWTRVILAATGFFAVVALVGWLDYYTWGGWWVSYANNYLYNRVYGVSSIWGEHPWFFYPLELGKNSAGLFWLAIGFALFRKPRHTWLPLALIASLLLSHTLIPHKEYRFITVVVPLCLLLVAVLLNDLWQARQSWRGTWRQPLVIGLTLYPLIGIVALFVFLKRDPGLRAYLDLNDQPEVVSVLNLHEEWFSTGGYYYLHRDVPIYYASNVGQLDPAQWSRYFSHIIGPADQPPVPGFTIINQIDNLAIQAAVEPPTDSLGIDNRVPGQEGIDGVYTPRVFPRYETY